MANKSIIKSAQLALLFFSLTCLSLPLIAQDGIQSIKGGKSLNGDGNSKMGIRLGVHVSQLKDAKATLLDASLVNFYVGLFRQRKLIPFFAFRYGLEYHASGSKENSNTYVKLGYISAPIAGVFKFGPIEAYGGVSPGVRIYKNIQNNGIKIDNPTQDLSSVDASAFVGATAKILFLGLDFQYHWGLVNVADEYVINYWQLGGVIFF